MCLPRNVWRFDDDTIRRSLVIEEVAHHAISPRRRDWFIFAFEPDEGEMAWDATSRWDGTWRPPGVTP